MAGLRVGVLGPLFVRRDGVTLALNSPMLRSLLGLLAVQPHRLVTRDEIIDTLWGENPPPTCVTSIHVYIGRLRTLAEPERAPRSEGLIGVVGQRGYVLRPAPGQLDLLEFLALAERATAETGTSVDGAARIMAEALRCWRGRPLAGVGGRLADHPAVAALSQRRTTMAVAYADAAVQLLADRHTSATGHREHALGLLRELAHEQPMHEGIHARLMVLLAATGQQAAALSLYAELRARLDDELGVEPGRDLAEAHLRVLRHEVTAGATATGPGPIAVRPAQLPSAVPSFIGRTEALSRLDAALVGPAATGVPVAVLVGTAGVGKTALAVRWAHRAAGEFPDGQLFVALHGYSRTPPVRPIAALAQVLRSLGVAPTEIPPDVDEAASLYRTLLTQRRILVVLDNANNPEQVRPLLPGAPGCAVLVTSRDRLAGLVARDGAQRIGIDVLGADEAAALLADIIGTERTTAEPEATVQLAALCGHLPLALRIAAGNLRSRPHVTIADYVARLRAENPVSALSVEGDEDAAVRAAFDLSYRALPAPAQRLFRLAGLVPSPDFAEAAAAALIGLDPPQTERILDTLCGAHLLAPLGDGRYAMHDLLRAYAVDRVAVAEPDAERRAATDRLLAWYQRGVTGATEKLYPERLRLPGPADVDPLAFDTAGAALAWLDAERAGLFAAAAHGPAEIAWRLMDALRTYCSQRVPTADWLPLTTVGMSAARRANNALGQAAAHASRAEIALRRGRYGQAIDDYQRAVELSRQTGWLAGEAAALGNLGVVCRFVGRVQDAVDHLMASLELNVAAGRIPGQAMVLGGLGIAHRELGNLHQAAGCVVRAVDLFRTTGSVGGQAAGLDNLGEVYCLQGRLDEADACLTEALRLFRELGSRANEAVALRGLADVQCARGQHVAALELAMRGLELGRETADRLIEMDALNSLGAIHHGGGRTDEAAGYYRHALRLARDAGHRYPEARSLVGLAELPYDEPESATTWARQALAVTTACGYRLLGERARTVASGPVLALSDSLGCPP